MTSSSRRPPKRAVGTTRGSRAYRAAPPQSFLQRNRVKALWGLAVLAFVAIAAMAFQNATQPVYACSTEWQAQPTPSTAPSATPRLGQVQDDMGRDHVSVGTFVKYALCPPASGNHFNQSGEGPIRPGVYNPDDSTVPQNWIHNLEHGGLVVLYRCKDGDSGCSDSQQQAFKTYVSNFPNSPICNLPAGSLSPVITRFDQMDYPFVALLWGQVLPMQAWDPDLVTSFFNQQAERTNPETLCARPTATPPNPIPTPSGSAGASSSPAPSSTTAPTATPGAS